MNLFLRTFRLVCIAIVAIAFLAPSIADAKPRAKNPVPIQGVYLYCKSLAYCQPHIDRLMHAGVRVFITPPYNDAREIHDYIAAKGGSIYWNVSIIGKDSAIAKVANWSNTAGFYIVDEPAYNNKGGEVQWWHNYVRSLTTKPTVIVHWACSGKEVRQAVHPFITAAEIHGSDCYPQTYGGKAKPYLRRLLTDAWTQTAKIGHKRGQPAIAVAKAFSWSDVPNEDPTGGTDAFPSWSEFHTMASAARKSGVQMLIWWGYDRWKDSPDADARWAAFNGAFA